MFFPGRASLPSGAVCAVAQRNLVMILIGVEIMLNAAGLAFSGASSAAEHLEGQASSSSS
jgi:NADH-quinone oxidoreductase subunit K